MSTDKSQVTPEENFEYDPESPLKQELTDKNQNLERGDDTVLYLYTIWLKFSY